MTGMSILRAMRVTSLALVILLTACSPLVVVVEPSSVAPAPSAVPGSTSAPTLAPTAIPAATQQPAATAVPTEAGCTDKAQYIGDDGTDGTTIPPSTAFTKSWVVKNTGSCTWDSRYIVYKISGTSLLQAPYYFIVAQGRTVAPGRTVKISVALATPSSSGTYKSYWGLKNQYGQPIPVQGGANGDSFYVLVNVSDESVHYGDVTNASISIDLEQGSGAICTADSTYLVHATITSDGPTTANYEIGSSAGQIPAGYFETSGTSGSSVSVTGTIAFDQAETKSISLRFVGPYPYPDNLTMLLRVNGGPWHNARVMCP